MTVGVPPQVSIVIPCRNEREHIIPCLDSILASDFPLDHLEVLLVDGMSEDGTRAVIERYIERHSGIRLLDNAKRVTPSALNIGISEARGAIIVRMDAHAQYPPNYITDLVGWLERTGADNVGGACVTLPGDATATARAIAAVLAHPFGIGNAHFRLGTVEPRKVDTVPFGCFRREVFQRVGLFDEDLVRNQDDEFNLRLLRAGGRVLLVPGVVSFYYPRRSVRQLARMFFQYGYFKPLVLRKVRRVMTARQLAPVMLVSTLLLAALLGTWFAAARLVFSLTLGGYVATDLAAAGVIARRSGFRVGLVASAVFPVIHFAYGFGYLKGVVDFLVRRKLPNPAVTLSR
jgi:glycosyltransferase involved in cell wall biosynthesis